MFDLNFSRACSPTGASALFRVEPSDFVVEEQLGFDLTGSGEHLCLHIEKVGQNSLWVAKQLAGHFGVRMNDVGYCGLKDRQAVARQWFSVRTGARVDGLSGDLFEGVRVLEGRRHAKKLRQGEHAGNAFTIRLRSIVGDRALLQERFQLIAKEGVPNYFGEQRFGINGGNLEQAAQLATEHPSVWRQRQHQFALSAIRAWIFNCVLAERVKDNSWQVLQEGDPEDHPSGPLWGRGRLASKGELLNLEERVVDQYSSWRNVLEHIGVAQERRQLRLLPDNMTFEWCGANGVLTFSLPSGTFATSVIRELLDAQRPGR
jgi:tRNA pseudouridine13 synthase